MLPERVSGAKTERSQSPCPINSHCVNIKNLKKNFEPLGFLPPWLGRSRTIRIVREHIQTRQKRYESRFLDF